MESGFLTYSVLTLVSRILIMLLGAVALIGYGVQQLLVLSDTEGVDIISCGQKLTDSRYQEVKGCKPDLGNAVEVVVKGTHERSFIPLLDAKGKVTPVVFKVELGGKPLVVPANVAIDIRGEANAEPRWEGPIHDKLVAAGVPDEYGMIQQSPPPSSMWAIASIIGGLLLIGFTILGAVGHARREPDDAAPPAV